MAGSILAAPGAELQISLHRWLDGQQSVFLWPRGWTVSVNHCATAPCVILSSAGGQRDRPHVVCRYIGWRPLRHSSTSGVGVGPAPVPLCCSGGAKSFRHAMGCQRSPWSRVRQGNCSRGLIARAVRRFGVWCGLPTRVLPVKTGHQRRSLEEFPQILGATGAEPLGEKGFVNWGSGKGDPAVR